MVMRESTHDSSQPFEVLSFHAEPIKPRFIGPVSMIFWVALFFFGLGFSFKGFENISESYSSWICMLSPFAVFFAFVKIYHYIDYHSKKRFTRKYRLDQDGIRITYSLADNYYSWDEVEGWIDLEGAMLGENRWIKVRLLSGEEIDLEVPASRDAYLVKFLDEKTRHLDFLGS